MFSVLEDLICHTIEEKIQQEDEDDMKAQ